MWAFCPDFQECGSDPGIQPKPNAEVPPASLLPVTPSRLPRLLAIGVVALAVLMGPAAAMASATPTAEATALAGLQASWQRMNVQQKLGTCNAYRRNRTLMITTAAAAEWKKPAARKGMSKAGWAKTYKRYFAWACSGAGTSPRP
jgi:hypothetical protein